MVTVFKPVVPDYEVILYCYLSFKKGNKPYCNYVELKGMEVYTQQEGYESEEEMLVPMLKYVLRKLETE